jgi:diadenosine tetraphosphate (Ap4A) HIT family hydrolase
MKFELDKRLQADTLFVARAGNCQIRLSKDARYPWLILIPEVANIYELDDLSWDVQLQILALSNALSKVLKQLYKPQKLNVASLGNMVKQLHIHHIARFEYDEAWPNPVWGLGDFCAYAESAIDDEINKIRTALFNYYEGEIDANNNN